MFNSSIIISISIQLNGGQYSSNCPLVKACHELHLNIIRTEIKMWKDQSGSDDCFLERFDSVFPRGFIRRDIERAKNILYDLYDIAISPVLRFELSPIYTYVMYKLIEEWFDCWDGEKDMIYVPRGIKTYLRQHHISKDDYETVISWFTNGFVCANDFAETYNGDYVSLRFAEEVAGMYLKGGANAFGLRALRVTIDEFFDLLPNDLRDLCIKKFESEDQMINLQQASPQTEDDNPVVFISYSWDNEPHKKWVKDLSERLTETGVQVILDQNDLMLGDPLPQFMERSIIHSDYVLIICTPEYKKKADARKGGVGYEESIITGDIFATQNHRKYITVLASGTWEASTPIWAGGKYGVNLSNLKFEGEEFEKLVRTLSQ